MMSSCALAACKEHVKVKLTLEKRAKVFCRPVRFHCPRSKALPNFGLGTRLGSPLHEEGKKLGLKEGVHIAYLHPGLLLSWECVWHFTMVSSVAAPECQHFLFPPCPSSYPPPPIPLLLLPSSYPPPPSPLLLPPSSPLPPTPLLLPSPPSHTHACSPPGASFSLLWLPLAASGERLPTRIVHCVPTLILANLHRWTQSGRCSSPIPSLDSKYWNKVMLFTVQIGAQHKDWFLSLIFMR